MKPELNIILALRNAIDFAFRRDFLRIKQKKIFSSNHINLYQSRMTRKEVYLTQTKQE